MTAVIRALNERLNFAGRHSGLMKHDSGVLLIVERIAPHFNAARSSVLFPDMHSICLSFMVKL
jgi:hypothetical protein